MKTKYTNFGIFFSLFSHFLATEKTFEITSFSNFFLISLYGEYLAAKITVELQMIWHSAN